MQTLSVQIKEKSMTQLLFSDNVFIQSKLKCLFLRVPIQKDKQ